MPAVPPEDDGLPPRDEDGRFTTGGHHEPEPEPEPETVKVRVHNAHRGAPHPGAVITLPADEARALIREGLADRVPA